MNRNIRSSKKRKVKFLLFLKVDTTPLLFSNALPNSYWMETRDEKTIKNRKRKTQKNEFQNREKKTDPTHKKMVGNGHHRSESIR